MKRYIKLLLLALLIFGLGCKQPTNYDECVLKNVKEDMNEMAVRAVIKSCANKFPDDDEEEVTTGPSERNLTPSELSNLTGRAGLRYGSTYGGSNYNGNPGLIVTDIEIAISTTSDGEEVTRVYNDDVYILPNTTGDFRFDIIVGDQNADYSWSIRSATGQPRN
jgi:hypothetical protein